MNSLNLAICIYISYIIVFPVIHPYICIYLYMIFIIYQMQSYRKYMFIISRTHVWYIHTHTPSWKTFTIWLPSSIWLANLKMMVVIIVAKSSPNWRKTRSGAIKRCWLENHWTKQRVVAGKIIELDVLFIAMFDCWRVSSIVIVVAWPDVPIKLQLQKLYQVLKQVCSTGLKN